MRKWFVWVISAGIAAAVLAGCGGPSKATPTPSPAAAKATTAAATATATAAAPASPYDLIAIKKAPASLAGDDAAWKDAAVTPVKTLVIAGSKATAAVTANMQALYNDTDIWLRIEWPDATQNDLAAFTWDGSKWAPPAQSDRLAINWAITKIADFDEKGCGGVCHKSTTDPIEKWYMIAPKAGDLIDTWQWTAAFTGPAGQTNDQTIVGGELPDPKVMESSIIGDKLGNGGGGYVNNAAAAPAVGPVKMQDPSKPRTYGPKYVAEADAIPLDMSKIKPGDTVPRRLLAPYVGSRGDVQAKQAYAGGKWTLVLHRKLDTGYADDVKFDTKQTYTFGLGVFNDLDHYNHTVADGAYLLKFKLP